MADLTSKNANGMFVQEMFFSPTENMTQKDLNVFVTHLLHHLYRNKQGDRLPVLETDNSMLMLVQMLVDMGISFKPDGFEELPEEIKKFFVVQERNGVKYRYSKAQYKRK